jgi:hypothetical protein
MRVYRWDLDKTYLDTDFHSLRGVVRAATEPAHRKRALPGAGALLRALSVQDDSSVMVVSGSPRQMRGVLSEKLKLDGVRFDQLVLKDNLGNVRRGRFRAIKGQIGYKLPALLRARAATPVHATEVLFGDDVEADALVYSLYADAISGRVGAAEVSRVMEKAGAYPDEIDLALAALVEIEPADAVERVFIRQERGVSIERLAALGSRVVPVRSWWQAALVLAEMGHLAPEAVAAVMVRVFEEEDRDPWVMGALAQDVVRRGCLSPSAFDGLVGPEPLLESVCAAVAALGTQQLDAGRQGSVEIDYLKFLSGGVIGRHGRLE